MRGSTSPQGALASGHRQAQRHVAHLVYRFAAGGLENVIVQLINHLPHDRYRHTVIAMTDVDQAFAQRITAPDVQLVALKMPKGHPYRHYPHYARQLRQLRPDVLHSCNLAALEIQPAAWLAGVGRRVHVEHGWDVSDPDGRNWKYKLVRRALLGFPTHVAAVSHQLHRYVQDLTWPHAPALFLPNGVDTQKFRPAAAQEAAPADYPFDPHVHMVFGTVGRLEPIKNQALLVDAFAHAIRQWPAETGHWRLMLAGGGPDADALRERIAQHGLAERAWMAGVRADVPQLLRTIQCFVLPSLAEGTSCTLQEAMASATPIIATDVGGNADLLEHGRLGQLVPSQDAPEMAQAMLAAARGPRHNDLARQVALQQHDLAGTVATYDRLFGA